MPNWLIQAGKPGGEGINDGQTRYFPPCGALESNVLEADIEHLARDAYTLDKLYVRVISNTINGNTTVRSRDNGANGNQSVVIGATATGVFEDNVNTDAIASGQTFNSQGVALGSSGSLKISIISYRLATAITTTPVMGNRQDDNKAQGSLWYNALGGSNVWVLAEAESQLTFRVAATLTYLRIYLDANTVLAASTFITRVNAGDGNLICTIGAGLTGAFEDIVNNDGINIGDEVNYELDVGAGGTSIGPEYFHIKSDSDGRQIINGPANGSILFDTAAKYMAVEGSVALWSATEANCQTECRTSLTAANMFLYVDANTLDGSCYFCLRQNGADSLLLITVGTGLTGVFEDLVNTVNFNETDLINWFAGDIDSTVGTLVYDMLSFEQQQWDGGGGGGIPLAGMAGKLIAERII